MGLAEEKLSDEECSVVRSSLSVTDSPYLISVDDAQGHVNESSEFVAEAAPIEDSKSFESFFINAAQVPVPENVEESAAPVENGEAKPEEAVADDNQANGDEGQGDAPIETGAVNGEQPDPEPVNVDSTEVAENSGKQVPMDTTEPVETGEPEPVTES